MAGGIDGSSGSEGKSGTCLDSHYKGEMYEKQASGGALTGGSVYLLWCRALNPTELDHHTSCTPQQHICNICNPFSNRPIFIRLFFFSFNGLYFLWLVLWAVCSKCCRAKQCNNMLPVTLLQVSSHMPAIKLVAVHNKHTRLAFYEGKKRKLFVML